MGNIAVRVSDVGKLYRIGGFGQRHDTLRDSIASAVTAPWHRIRNPGHGSRNLEAMWALRHVSLDVATGEVIGIIGRNGAGKTTLLKVLSRITRPTEGRVEIRGRVSSLLEVGTGFHPELSGRENVYLNGAILGMRRAEIDRKFDEIVAFAEVERFLDTPVKRYSSGMYVRLAFAVAAHLEPEVLIVDEVLAVGDAAFQAKCLGKMGEVARQGRTVLFVSHNMATIQAICEKAVWLNAGTVACQGGVRDTVEAYQLDLACKVTDSELRDRRDREGDGSARVTSVSIEDADGCAVITPRSRLKVTIEYESRGKLTNAAFVAAAYDRNSAAVFYLDSQTSEFPSALEPLGRVVCTTEPIHLSPRCYSLNIAILKGGASGTWADYVQNAACFDVIEGDTNGSGRLPPPHVLFVIDGKWQAESASRQGEADSRG